MGNRAGQVGAELIVLQRDLATGLAGVSSLGEALALCVDAAIRISGMDCGGMYVVSADRRTLRLACARGLSKGFIESTLCWEKGSDRWRVVMRGRPIYTRYEEAGVSLGEADKREGLKALAVLPVKHRGRVIACLNVASHRLREVPLARRTRLEEIARQVGNAIARVQAEEEIWKSHRELRDLVRERTAELAAAGEALKAEAAKRRHQGVALQESEGRFRAVCEESPIGVAVHRDLRLLYANPALVSMFGWSGSEEMTGRSVLDFIAPPLRPEVAQEVRRVQLGEPAPVRVSIGLKEDGTPVPFYVNRIPIDLPDGKAVVSFLVDISDIKQLEGALEGERDARDSLAEAIGTPVVILDHEGKVLRWNACARDVSGYSEKEVCGKAFVDALLAEEDRAEGRRLLEQACRGGKVSTFVRPLMCKDGRQMLMRWHCSPLRDGIRGTTGLLLIGYDITKTWPQTPGPGGPA